MMASMLVGEVQRQKYQQNCEEYDEITNMFKELGKGKLERRDVLNNIKSMVENGLVSKLEEIVDDIEEYERW